MKDLVEGARLASFSRPVTVRVPAEVLFDLEKIQKVQRDILGRLGCRACCSGFDIAFVVEREFIVDAQLNVRSSDPMPARASGQG